VEKSTAQGARPTPAIRRPVLRKTLPELFQVKETILIPKEPYDPIGHADGLVRFIDENTVLVNDYSAIDKGFGRRLRAIFKKHRLEWEELPYLISGLGDDGIQSAIGCFINYLRVQQVIVVPTFGIKQDDRAVCRMEQLFPDATIVPLRCEDLARKGGVLNCCTWSLRTSGKFSSRHLTHV
jgi:agmatine deiminase